MFEKDKAPISNEILTLFEEVRVAYLSARADPKEYGSRWRKAIEKIEEAYDSISPLGKEVKEYLDERHIEADDASSPSSGTAKIIYESIKQMRFDSENVNDPFSKKLKGKVLESLLTDIGIFIKFIHYAIRSDDDALIEDAYTKFEYEADKITDGLEGLDLAVEDVPLFIIEHYGDDKDSKKVMPKFKAALAELEKIFLSNKSEEEWKELVRVELKKSMSAMMAQASKFKQRMENPTMRVEEKPDVTQNVAVVEMDANVSGDCCEQLKQDLIEFDRTRLENLAETWGSWEAFVKDFNAEYGGSGYSYDIEEEVQDYIEYLNGLDCEELYQRSTGLLELFNDNSKISNLIQRTIDRYESCNSFGSDFSDKYAMLKSKKSEEEKATSNFIIPNKPMYRIFDIEDMEELQGFSGDYVVQEKYDGMRIQIHKIDGKVQIFSFNKQDITDKCAEQVAELNKKSYGDCILDAELILFDGDKALHRADTISHVFKNQYPDAKLRAHVFDIMRHEEKNLTDEELEVRINTLFNNYSSKSSQPLEFPSKKDTRIADSLKDIEEYAKEIMEMPTAEGVVIKDLTSTYFIGTKKNPKWVKWKKFVDLDMMVLDKKSTKSNLFSYTLGAGPVLEEDKNTVEMNGVLYMNVGKALNTKIDVKVGEIIRVKVDEVKESDGKFTLFSAKVIEVPEAATPDKIVTLELLSKNTKPSLKYKVEALKKGITITDNIHGSATIIAKAMDGFTVYGFNENNLMSKNAIVDLDMWKQQAEDTLKTLQGTLRAAIVNQIKAKGRENLTKGVLGLNLTEVHNFLVANHPSEYESVLDSNRESLGNFIESSEHTNLQNGIATIDDTVVQKEVDSNLGEFKVYTRKDGNLDFIINYKGENLSWYIDLDSDDDIFSLFGKATKFPAEISTNISKEKLIDTGEVEIGVQRHGYHEYILNGNKFETKIHFRVVEDGDKPMWIVWTGYEQKPVDKDTDEGIWNIYEDKYKGLKYRKDTEDTELIK